MIIQFLLSEVPWAFRQMAVLLSLRLLPFAVYGTWRCLNTPHRLLIAVAYLMIPAAACGLGDPLTIGLIGMGSVYYLLLSVGVYRLSALMAAGLLTRGAVFVVLFFAFLLLPGVLLPGTAIVAFLVVGLELLLSSYSYCVETSHPGVVRTSLGECLFFLLVNPTVVYTTRGVRRTGRSGLQGIGRAAAGAALMFVNLALLRPLARALRDTTAMRVLPGGAHLTWLLYGIAHFLTFYVAHAGLASVHIGLMRQMGWVIPERYRFPLAARNPMDFWRRWNTYVRVWLEAYVFLPIARRLSTSTRRGGPVVAAVTTLIASGLMHDAFIFAGRQTFAGFKKTQVFLAACALIAVWRLMGLFIEMLRRTRNAGPRPYFDPTARVAARVGLAMAVACAANLWG